VPHTNSDGTAGTDLYIDPADFRAVFAADPTWCPFRVSVAAGGEEQGLPGGQPGTGLGSLVWRMH
jgi:hypothetical protein